MNESHTMQAPGAETRFLTKTGVLDRRAVRRHE
jgi:hypothetical protein